MRSLSRLAATSAIALTLGAGCRVQPALPEEPRSLARRLESSTDRDRAACQLFALSRYRATPRYAEERCTTIAGEVNHVVATSQPDGTAIYVVFRNPRYPLPVAGPGRPKGPFALIDGDGYLLPVFGAANYLEAEDDVFEYDGARGLAVAHTIRHGGGQDASKWTALVLHIVPVRAAQQSVLSVVLGPPTLPSDPVCAGFYWSWRHRDVDGDGVPEIEIGPRLSSAGAIRPRAVYRWSNDRQTYVGPSGSVEHGFVRVDTAPQTGDCCPFGTAIEAFVHARRTLPIPGDPTAVRADECDNGVSFVEH